ncbi:hypothetical protein AYL99_02653 [Fonsecaea erecta]|uniref:PHD-type domain-containing protein n=1 Tax=Fonsecaea erecta TaxID=1367422 RepID=A0A178ZVH3_9EURO|nr:hypothetical protein AYL99_02653 [Fonsecaea erecta]OAP63426.1 hypothetical protein AYL99_02653 [Fonsecaea erecta]
MASPPRSSLAPSEASNDLRSHVIQNSDNDHHKQFSMPSSHYNIPPAIPVLNFSVTSDGLNNHVELLGPHRPPQVDFGPTSYPRSGPRRGSFPDILPHGHTPPPPINITMPPAKARKSGLFTGFRAGQEDMDTDSDLEFLYSIPCSNADKAQTPSPVTNTDKIDKDTTTTVGEVVAPSIASDGNPPSTKVAESSVSGRNKQDVPSNSPVVPDKGLTGDKPDIKREPSNIQAPGDDQTSPQVVPANAIDQPSNYSMPPSKKRKSGASRTSESNQRASTSASTATPSRESSEEYNPSGHTRSGRQIQKPVSLSEGTPVHASPSRKPSRNNSTANTMSNSPASIKTHPKIKRRVYRGREQFALCEHCLRGHGPPGNVIVFCDACNKCWHQRCHEPQISSQTVSDSKAEWFCSECDRILHGKKKDKKANGKAGAQLAVVAPPVVEQKPTFTGPRVGGRFLRPEQKEAYLKTLSRDDLVSLVLQASDLAPDLPLFQRAAPPPPPPVVMPQAQFTSTYVTPVTKVPSFGDNDAGDDNELDEGYDGYFDEHAALYPKPGNGVQLPPESEDLHVLLEGKESKTFSHWVQGMPGKLFSGSGNVSSTVY